MEVKPLKSFVKTLAPAPDKSVTHRAIMLNSVARGKAEITNALLGADCMSTIECMRAMGAKIEVDGSRVLVEGGEELKPAEMYVGNSGTTLRLLTGLLTGYPGKFVLDGDASIRKRPMKRVVEPLREMGAKITFSEGVRAPLSVTGARLKGISYNMPVASAQVKSAILLAGLNADGITTVHETIRSRNHTELMLKAMGAKIWIENHATAIMRGTLTAIDVDVPGDISSAAYPMVLAACLKGAHVTLKNVGVNPTRTGIITVMKECGAAVEESQVRYAVEKIATLDVSYTGNMKPFNIERELIPYLIDEIPVLAVLACFIDGESVITGAEELKVKESNRIDTTVGMLKAMGADITATDDGMIIRGGKGLKGGATIDPRGDHRIAMAAAVAAAMSERGADILDPGCVAVSYPDFFRILEE